MAGGGVRRGRGLRVDYGQDYGDYGITGLRDYGITGLRDYGDYGDYGDRITVTVYYFPLFFAGRDESG